MERSPERYLLYYILIGSLGSMLLLYGISALSDHDEIVSQPAIAIFAFVIVLLLAALGIGIFIQRVKHIKRKSR